MNYIKETFDITNKNIQLATPLILYSLFSSIYLAVSTYGKTSNLILTFLLFIFMTVAFISGWFNMIKQCIVSPGNSINTSFKTFPEGVGEYFLPTLGTSIMIFFVSTFFLVCSIYLGLHSIGNPELDTAALSNAVKTTADMKLFLSGLSAGQLSKLALWNMLLLGYMSFTSFLLVFYLPALFFKTKNFLRAFILGLKDLFSKKILYTVTLYLLIFIGYTIISVLSGMFFENVIIHFIITLLTFYYIVFITIAVFHFYYHNFVKSQIGQNIDKIV